MSDVMLPEYEQLHRLAREFWDEYADANMQAVARLNACGWDRVWNQDHT